MPKQTAAAMPFKKAASPAALATRSAAKLVAVVVLLLATIFVAYVAL